MNRIRCLCKNKKKKTTTKQNVKLTLSSPGTRKSSSSSASKHVILEPTNPHHSCHLQNKPDSFSLSQVPSFTISRWAIKLSHSKELVLKGELLKITVITSARCSALRVHNNRRSLAGDHDFEGVRKVALWGPQTHVQTIRAH